MQLTITMESAADIRLKNWISQNIAFDPRDIRQKLKFKHPFEGPEKFSLPLGVNSYAKYLNLRRIDSLHRREERKKRKGKMKREENWRDFRSSARRRKKRTRRRRRGRKKTRMARGVWLSFSIIAWCNESKQAAASRCSAAPGSRLNIFVRRFGVTWKRARARASTMFSINILHRAAVAVCPAMLLRDEHVTSTNIFARVSNDVNRRPPCYHPPRFPLKSTSFGRRRERSKSHGPVLLYHFTRLPLRIYTYPFARV